MPLMITTSANYHSVTSIRASTYDGRALKLTLYGDQSASESQFNQAEVTIFTENAGMVRRLIAAINSVVPPHKEAVFEAFMREELNRMDAIEVLQEQFALSSREAEALVEAWES